MEWFFAKSTKPNSGKHVLAYYQNERGIGRIVKAFYAEKHTIESSSHEYSDAPLNDEYCEELDQYFLKPGWYECIDNWEEYSSIVINEGEVTRWAYLVWPEVAE